MSLRQHHPTDPIVRGAMAQVETRPARQSNGERTPLLLSADSSSSDEDPDYTVFGGKANVLQTVLNISKTCMGTGTLALPFAARQAGAIVNILGMLAIVGWNMYSVNRLCLCLEMLPNKSRSKGPPEGTSTLSVVAFHALGPMGMHAVDVMFVVLLLGVIVAYEGKPNSARMLQISLKETRNLSHKH